MDFCKRMELGRTLAKRRRDRGLATGKGAKGWQWQRPALDPRDWQSTFLHTFEQWRSDAREALNDYQAACFNGPTWEADCEIPF